MGGFLSSDLRRVTLQIDRALLPFLHVSSCWHLRYYHRLSFENSCGIATVTYLLIKYFLSSVKERFLVRSLMQ
jgi:hypothetical protein